MKCGYIEAHIVKNDFRHPNFWIRLVKINDYLTFKKLKAHVYSDRFVLFKYFKLFFDVNNVIFLIQR